MEEDEFKAVIQSLNRQIGAVLPGGTMLYQTSSGAVTAVPASQVSSYNNGGLTQNRGQVAANSVPNLNTAGIPLRTPRSNSTESSRKPLLLSELQVLLFTFVEVNALINFKVAWLQRQSSNGDGWPLRDLGAAIIQLHLQPLLQLPADLMRDLEATALSWRREIGALLTDELTIELAIERKVDPDSLNDWEAEEKKLRNLLTIYRLGNEQETQPTYVEPDENDPPGVRLGLVKKTL